MPESGVYQAAHRRHRAPHLLLALKGESFPACRTCGAGAAFELSDGVPHVTHDWDFAGPNLVLVQGEKQKRKRA